MPWHIILTHGTYEWVMPHIRWSDCMAAKVLVLMGEWVITHRTSHFTCKCGMCHGTWMSHGTYEWVMAHMNESWHIWMGHGTYQMDGFWGNKTTSALQLFLNSQRFEDGQGSGVAHWEAVNVGVSQCAAVRCSVLQCVAVYCSALQCIAVHCSALQCIAVHCSALQCIAVCASVLYHNLGCRGGVTH